MMAELNKYEVISNPGKFNSMSSGQYYILALVSIVKKPKTTT